MTGSGWGMGWSQILPRGNAQRAMYPGDPGRSPPGSRDRDHRWWNRRARAQASSYLILKGSHSLREWG